MNDDTALFVFGLIVGALIVGIVSVAIFVNINPGSSMECNPGSHAVQTSDNNHYRWYDCQPITP